MTTPTIIERLEDAASAALTLANNAGKVAHKHGIHMASVKAAGELGQAIIAVQQELEQWKATLWAVARELDCLPSTFSDANGHVLKAAIKHMKDARRYRWLRDDTDSDWAICEWSTQESDGIGYYRDARAPAIVDAAIDTAMTKAAAAVPPKVTPLTRCAAGRDGDCIHAQCPQLRDGEPHKTSRHCPLDA